MVMKKLKRLLKRRRKNSGFTLVEMVISCGLLGILVVGITLFIAPVMKSAASNEVNVRATLLAETVNNYISRSTRNALYVKVFTNADRAAAEKADGAIATNKDLKTMQEFVNGCIDTVNNQKVYELKCISFSWENDPQTQENKYMVMNETFANSSSTKLNTTPIPVFENCFYEGLFPEFIVEQLEGTDVAPAESGSSSSSSDPDEKKPVPAMKITTKVYNDQNMGSPEFIGVGYTEFGSIKNKTINAKGKYKFFLPEKLNGKDTYNTTFIYYVVRKSMASEALPGSSSSSSSSSSSTT